MSNEYEYEKIILLYCMSFIFVIFGLENISEQLWVFRVGQFLSANYFIFSYVMLNENTSVIYIKWRIYTYRKIVIYKFKFGISK